MPVELGLPPVTWATMPGKESDGNGVCALVKLTPFNTSLASAEPGCPATYQARSDWCRPSTEISRTCLPLFSVAPAGCAATTTPASPSVASTARTRNRSRFISRVLQQGPRALPKGDGSKVGAASYAPGGCALTRCYGAERFA